MQTSNKETILVITELFPNPRSKSFSGVFVVDQLKALRQFFEIHLIVPYLKSIKEEILKPNKTEQQIEGLHIHYLKYFSILNFFLSIIGIKDQKFFNQNLKRLISKKILKTSIKLNQKYNFSLIHGHEIFVGDEAAKVGKHLQKPSFLTIHSLFEYHTQLFSSKTLKLFRMDIQKK